jgi:hypothetical protein
MAAPRARMSTSLPLSVRLTLAGLATTVLLIVGAVALRSSPSAALEEDDASAAPSASPAPDRRETGSGSSIVVQPAVAPASGSAPAVARASAGPAPPPSELARALRADLRKDLELGHYPAATEALGRLIELEPRSAEDGDVRGDIVELSMRVTLLTGPEPARVFDLVSTRMGPAGVDILYELVTTRGGSRAATRAEELLHDAAVRARGTPALRMAYDLRMAPGCDEKRALFARAKGEGDGRTLGQLQILNRRCGRHGASCCLQNDPALRETMDGIKARSN